MEANEDSLDGTEMGHAFQVMEQMRREQLLCDVTLVAGNIEVYAHKMVLSAFSRCFYAELVLTKENQGKCRIVLPSGISPEALTTLIDYMYGVKIRITERNAKRLLPAAHILKMNAVKNKCCKILESRLTPANCIDMNTIAENCECFELLKNVQCYIKKHSSEIVDTEQFRTLQFEKFLQLISKDTLRATSEERLYEAVMSWLKYDIKTRKKYLMALMQQVRMQLLPVAYLVENVAHEPLLKGDVKYRDLIIEAFQHQFKKKNSTPENAEEVSDGVVLAVLGGNNVEASNTMEYFDLEKGQRSEVIKIPHRVFGSAVTVDNRIFALSGEYSPTGIIYDYDVTSNKWIIANSNFPFQSQLMFNGTANDCIFVTDRQTSTRLVKFNCRTLCWSSVPVVPFDREYSHMAVVANKLFVIDAFDHLKIAVYDEDLKKWTTLPVCIRYRTGMGVGVLGDIIYLIGGYESGYLNCVEAIDTKTNILEQIAPLNASRAYHGVVTFNNLLYVVGGYDRTPLSSIEVYDAKENLWTLLPTTMTIKRRSPVVTLVNKSKLTNNL